VDGPVDGPAGRAALGPALDRWLPSGFLKLSAGLHVAALGAVAAAPRLWPAALGVIAADHLAAGVAGMVPRSRWLGPNVTRLPAGAGAAVANTIDDGPDPEVTPAVLDLLDAHGARASFFCIAERARAAPALAREIVRRGHDVQNHSRHHRHDFALRGPRALAREVGDAQSMLADTTGVAPRCFRAPAGLRNPFLDPVLHRLGLHLVSWTRRGFDTRSDEPQRVLGRLTRDLAACDIVLLHDGHARRSVAGRPVLLDVWPPLIAQCRAAGLRTVTLDAALPPRGTSAAATALSG
jgi:peptidoglycan/xylan/chitin deacetylase (PgdA/CDA1 family)